MRQTIDEILDKIPDEFNIQDMAARAEERTPYTTVVFQECERMNILMQEIKMSLAKLNLGLKVGHDVVYFRKYSRGNLITKIFQEN